MATFPSHLLDSIDRSVPPLAQWMSVVTHLDPQYGGLSAVLPELTAAVNRTGLCSSKISAFCAPDEQVPSPGQSAAHEDVRILRWPMGRRPWLTDTKLRAQFQNAVRATDGLHLHGLWEQSTLIGARSARALNKPYVVSAHGMLERWALGNKRLKKQVYSALVERTNLRGAACLHALTAAEAEDYRRYGASGPVAIIPNGVQVPQRVSGSLFLREHPELEGKRLVLFLGRIHFKKGLDLLVDAWAGIAPDWPDAHLVLAGPDSEQTLAAVERRVQELGITQRVSFTGMLDAPRKWSALSAAECFVLPSYSEGLSVSTLEAMGMGLPVIITEQCNLPEVQHSGAGWEIRSELSRLTSALRDCLSNLPAQNREIGHRGRKLVQARYTWSAVGAQMADLYRWVLGGSTPTSFELWRS